MVISGPNASHPVASKSLTCCPWHTSVYKQLDELGRQKLDRPNYWQQTRHAKLYSDLLPSFMIVMLPNLFSLIPSTGRTSTKFCRVTILHCNCGVLNMHMPLACDLSFMSYLWKTRHWDHHPKTSGEGGQNGHLSLDLDLQTLNAISTALTRWLCHQPWWQ